MSCAVQDASPLKWCSAKTPSPPVVFDQASASAIPAIRDNLTLAGLEADRAVRQTIQ
jgi:hypothetical protein